MNSQTLKMVSLNRLINDVMDSDYLNNFVIFAKYTCINNLIIQYIIIYYYIIIL